MPRRPVAQRGGRVRASAGAPRHWAHSNGQRPMDGGRGDRVRAVKMAVGDRRRPRLRGPATLTRAQRQNLTSGLKHLPNAGCACALQQSDSGTASGVFLAAPGGRHKAARRGARN